MEDIYSSRIPEAFKKQSRLGSQEWRILRKYAKDPHLKVEKVASGYGISKTTVLTYHQRIRKKMYELLGSNFPPCTNWQNMRRANHWFDMEFEGFIRCALVARISLLFKNKAVRSSDSAKTNNERCKKQVITAAW